MTHRTTGAEYVARAAEYVARVIEAAEQCPTGPHPDAVALRDLVRLEHTPVGSEEQPLLMSVMALSRAHRGHGCELEARMRAALEGPTTNPKVWAYGLRPGID